MFSLNNGLTHQQNLIMVRSFADLKKIHPKYFLQDLEITNFLRLTGADIKFNEFIEFSDQFISNFQADPSSVGHRPTLDKSETTYEAVKGNECVIPHGELYSLPNPPDLLFLYCNLPSLHGGETTIYDGFKVAKSLSKATHELFLNRKIKYSHKWGREQWAHFFKTENIEAALQKIESLPNVSGIKNDSERIQFEFATSGFSSCGAFVNGIANILSRKQQGINHVTWSDGEEIGSDVLVEINVTTKANEQEISWKAGEVLMVNNHRAMHGRKSFKGERRIAVRFGKSNL